MNRAESTRVLLEAKRQHDLTWTDPSRQTGKVTMNGKYLPYKRW